MRRVVALAFCGMVVVLALACGASELDVREARATTVYTAGARFDVHTLTDLDDVRDVAEVRESVVLATDRGVVIHSETTDQPPRRITSAQGLPSDDVRAVTASADGRVFVASGTEVATFVEGRDEPASPLAASPRLGTLRDVLVTRAGALWVCGDGGIARAQQGEFVRVGEPVRCTFLVESAEGHLWVGTESGLIFVEGDVLREHTVGVALPSGRVRALVPFEGKRALAIVQTSGASVLAYFDGLRWYSYTLPELRRRVVALTKRDADTALLWSDGAVLEISRGLEGARLVPLWRSAPFTVRSYRARIFPTAHLDLPPVQPETPASNAAKPLLVASRSDEPSVSAPSFSARVIENAVPSPLVHVEQSPRATFVVTPNAGVLAIRGDGTRRAFRTRDLARGRRLRIASDAWSRIWLVPAPGELVRAQSNRLWRARGPEGVDVLAVADGPAGAYLIGSIAGSSPQVLRAYRIRADRYELLLERPLPFPSPVVVAPFAAVDAGERIWLGVATSEESSDTPRARTRGAIVLDPRIDRVVYHHGNAERGPDGALKLPDEAYAIDLTIPDTAWFATLSGAVRLAGEQAIVFGQARGVPGEIVTDIAVRDRNLVWIAAAEGFGAYVGGQLEFGASGSDTAGRIVALDIDARGGLWTVSATGLYYATSAMALRREPLRFVRVAGLDATDLTDVYVDRDARVWALARNRLIVLSRTTTPSR